MTGTILKYPGSKNRIADKIISLFPDDYRNMTYIEPFFGSGTVFFRKAPSTVETINDLDGDVYNLFLQIRNNAEELARLIAYTPWSRQEYEYSHVRTESDIENARRFLVRYWFSVGASRYRSGWRHNVKGNSGSLDTFEKLPSLIRQASYRMCPTKNNIVQIENQDAFTLIERYSRPEVLMYLDPPYVPHSRRKNKKMYTHEMTDEDHIRLCGLIHKSPAKIVLSGYANDIYERFLKGFIKTAFQAFDERGNKRTEIIWTNFKTTLELFDLEELAL